MRPPTEFTGTIYFYYHLSYNFMIVNATELGDDEDYIYLGEKDVGTVHFDLDTEKVVEKLESKKEAIRKEQESRLKVVDRRIAEFLAIPNLSDEDENAFREDIPF